MKNIFIKIKEAIKANSMWLIWGIALILLIVLVLISFLFPTKEDDTVNVKPIYTESTKKVGSIYPSEELQNLNINTEANIYYINTPDRKDRVEELVKTLFTEDLIYSCVEEFCTWSNNKDFNNSISVLEDKSIGKITIYVGDKVKVNEDYKNFNTENSEEVYQALKTLTEILQIELEVKDLKKNADCYENNVIMGNLRIINKNYNEANISVCFNSQESKNRKFPNKIDIPNYEILESNSESRKLLDSNLLIRRISNGSLFAELYLDGATVFKIQKNYSGNSYWPTLENSEEVSFFSDPKTCEVNTIELTYVYTKVSLNDEVKYAILPHYLLSCESSVTYMKKDYTVPAKLIVDAADY